MEFRDLGVLRVEVDDLELPLPGRRIASVLARLLASVGEPVSADALVEATWGEQPPARAPQALETVVWRLRGVLEPGRGVRAAATVVRKQGDGYLLAVPDESVDSRRFTTLTDQANRALAAGKASDALALSEAGLLLWRGEPYASLTDASWLPAVRQELVERRLDMSACHVQALLDTGEPERALSALLPLLDEYPFDERLWGQRMLGLYRTGRQADALAAFGAAQRMLSGELGIDPGPALRSLQNAVLNQSPELDPPAAPQPAGQNAPLRLPSRRSALIGRDAAVAELTERTATHRLVTVTGPGGVGKTRVAIEAGHRMHARQPDGAWFVDLAGVRPEEGDVARLGEIIATTLELAPRADIPVSRMLAEHLRSRELLLIVDNCEQVLDAVCAVVDGILEDAPGVTVLTTSREPLDLAGESVVQLSPLAAEDAAALFVDRLAGVRPDLDPVGDSGEIGEICESVGGLPLGIELAAARARVFELNEVAASLADNAAGLSRSGRGPQRQASMQDTVDWSYRLARSDEQLLHRRLATLPGPVTLEAATALCSVSPLTGDQAPALVAGLVHRSLLISMRPSGRTGVTTFRQLVPTRAHAERLLDPADRAAAREACDRWVIDSIRRAALDGQIGQAEASAWVLANRTAVAATLNSTLVDASAPSGLELLTRLTLYWFERGQLLEAAHWYRGAAMADDSGVFTGGEAALARLLGLCARALSQDRLAAARIADELPELADPAEESASLVGQALVLAAVSTWVAQAHEVGLRVSSAAVRVGRRHGLPQVHVRARALADMHRLDSAERADAVLDAQQILRDPAGNEFAAFVAAYLCAVSASRDGEQSAAMDWAGRLAQAHRALAMHPTSELLEDLGGLLHRAGRRSDAVRCLAAASARHARDGVPWPRLPATTTVIDELTRSMSAAGYERLWRSGERLGTSLDPSVLLDEWFPAAGPTATGPASARQAS